MKLFLYFSMILGLGITLFVAELGIGTVKIPLFQILEILFEPSSSNLHQNIIHKIRLPRTLTAVLCGASLSVSGLLMQTFFRNPLASPSVLGITSGASLGTAFVILGAGSLSLTANLFGGHILIVSASAGSMVIMIIILLISRVLKNQTSLLIVGLMIGNLTISLVSIWQYFASPDQIKEYLLWTFGSLSSVEIAHLPLFFGVTSTTIGGAFLISKSLNLWVLGDEYARSLGVNIARTQFWIILLTSVSAGTVTAFCGIIGFVGLSVPHLTRFLFDTSDHRILIPASALVGISVLLGCDLVSRLPHESLVLPINIITSLVGSPIVLIVILRNQKHLTN